MNVRHKREADLMPHYESHPTYYSFANNSEVMKAVFNQFDRDLSKTESILDVGCGNGGLAKVFESESNAKYVGVDYCTIRVNMAKVSNIKNAEFHLNDVYEFLEGEIEKGNKYDVITIFEVLEHLEQPELIIEMSKKLLNEGGSIIASVPHNMPYVAHLQVYENPEAVKEKLNPDKFFLTSDNVHYFCTWN